MDEPGTGSGVGRSVRLASGEPMPALGQGTWRLAEGRRPRAEEIAALRLGLDLGMGLIDTAEMYGRGAAEELVGEAIAGRRDEVFLVSKVLPEHATRLGTIAACEASLGRLGADRLDLYLLHWRGRLPLEETVAGFRELVGSGRIRYWGVSNFDVGDLDELARLTGAGGVAADQVLYNLTRRDIEGELLPACQQRGLPVMAYTPIAQARILGHRALTAVATRLGATPAQVALAFVLRARGVCAIPGSGSRAHVRENRAALDLGLERADLAALDEAFPAPAGSPPLEMR